MREHEHPTCAYFGNACKRENVAAQARRRMGAIAITAASCAHQTVVAPFDRLISFERTARPVLCFDRWRNGPVLKQVSVALLFLALGVASSAVSLDGAFALQAGHSRVHAHMIAEQMRKSPFGRHLDLWLTDERARTITRYDIDMTKYLHLIVISDDLRTFMHVHPTLNDRDHHFRLKVQFPREGLYHIYADGTPHGLTQQVFRYDLRIGTKPDGVRDVARTGTDVICGPYRVDLGSTLLRVGSAGKLTIRISKNGAPAGDLRPYLGALAHAVFIRTSDLTYAHVHPMALDDPDARRASGTRESAAPAEMKMSNMGDIRMAHASFDIKHPSSPDMMLRTMIREAGTYKLWLQFRGRNRLYVAPFVLTAT